MKNLFQLLERQLSDRLQKKIQFQLAEDQNPDHSVFNAEEINRMWKKIDQNIDDKSRSTKGVSVHTPIRKKKNTNHIEKLFIQWAPLAALFLIALMGGKFFFDQDNSKQGFKGIVQVPDSMLTLELAIVGTTDIVKAARGQTVKEKDKVIFSITNKSMLIENELKLVVNLDGESFPVTNFKVDSYENRYLQVGEKYLGYTFKISGEHQFQILKTKGETKYVMDEFMVTVEK